MRCLTLRVLRTLRIGLFDVEENKEMVDCNITLTFQPFEVCCWSSEKTGIPAREFYADRFVYDKCSEGVFVLLAIGLRRGVGTGAWFDGGASIR